MLKVSLTTGILCEYSICHLQDERLYVSACFSSACYRPGRVLLVIRHWHLHIMIITTFTLWMQFEGLLPPLHALIREVEREELRGGRLLNLLHAKCHCGVPELQACMQRFVYLSSTCNTLSRSVEKYKGVVDCGFCG
jgi:hypothetical protein